jgi:hypothetical protein
VFCASKAAADEFVKQLEEHNVAFLYNHSEMESNIRNIMNVVMTEWAIKDIIMTTPVITVIINYDLNRIKGGWEPTHQFDAAYVYASNRSCCPSDVMQGIFRVRSYRRNVVYFRSS